MAITDRRKKYLDRSADSLCKAAYELCRDNFNKNARGSPPDPKQLKDICAAVKDVITITNSLSDGKEFSDEIRISVEGAAEEYAE